MDNFNLATKWDKQRLTWRVTKFPSNDLSDELVISTMERAFSVWAKYADLTFIEVGGGCIVYNLLSILPRLTTGLGILRSGKTVTLVMTR